MSAVDFAEWAEPNLDITLGGRTFSVRPPSVDEARLLIASAVRAEVNLGLAKGPVPDELQAMLDSIGDRHPALGDTYDEMVTEGISPVTIDRVGYYAVFYWTRGKAYADWIAVQLWTPREPGAAAPKVRRRSPRRSGRSTGKGSR